jgi:hypothetical protein
MRAGGNHLWGRIKRGIERRRERREWDLRRRLKVVGVRKESILSFGLLMWGEGVRREDDDDNL